MDTFFIEHASSGTTRREDLTGSEASVRARAELLHHFNGVDVTIHRVTDSGAYPIARIAEGRVVDIAPPPPPPSPLDKMAQRFGDLAETLKGKL